MTAVSTDMPSPLDLASVYPAIQTAIRQTNDRAIAAGVVGLPFSVIDDAEPFGRVDRLDVLERWLTTGGR